MFISLTKTDGVKVRINTDFIEFYEPYLSSSDGKTQTRIFIKDKTFFVEEECWFIDKLIDNKIKDITWQLKS